MKIYKGLETEFNCKNPVVTIGTFDGLHIGHQKIIERLKEEAKKINGESVLLTFYPHPRSVIESDHPISLLQAHEDKLLELEKLGLQHLIILPFTNELSTMSAYDFIKDILVAHIKLKKIVLGYDHHFGNNREGNLDFLNKHAQIMDFEVIEIPAKEIDEIKISSTKIREAIKNGEIEKATKFLGSICGLLFVGLITYGLWHQAIKSVMILEVSADTSNFPIWPWKLACPIGASLCVLTMIGQLFQQIFNSSTSKESQ